MRGFYRSTIGKKVVMATTGIVLVGFVIGHVAGNLLVFRGAAAMNEYAALLKANPLILWGVRGILLVAAVLHVVSALQLRQLDRRARPVGYDRARPQVSTVASRTMRIGGVVLLVFIVLHLLHFTTGHLHPRFSHTDVYGNVVVAFSIWWVAGLYILAMMALALHLYHGIWSVGRTLGVARPSGTPLRRRLTIGIALLVWLGFTGIPVAVLTGVLQ